MFPKVYMKNMESSDHGWVVMLPKDYIMNTVKYLFWQLKQLTSSHILYANSLWLHYSK